jgi:hypothetical protein
MKVGTSLQAMQISLHSISFQNIPPQVLGYDNTPVSRKNRHYGTGSWPASYG